LLDGIKYPKLTLWHYKLEVRLEFVPFRNILKLPIIL